MSALIHKTAFAAAGPQAEWILPLAGRVRDLGREIGLPNIAVAADISSPEPMLGPDGRPLAETVFEWIDPKLEYWKDRGFALRAPFVLASRYTAEPFFYTGGRFATWRPAPRLESIPVRSAAESFGVGAAVIAPAHLPGGVIGSVVWAGTASRPDLPQVFAERAAELHYAVLRLMAAYHEDAGGPPVRLTRREIQCLKWAAAGKTDQEIGQIIHVAHATVRFHLQNAAVKLGASGRAQTLHRASALGYIGMPRQAGAPGA